MNAHFFDLSVLIRIEAKVWIVSKTKPSIPLVKISESEFNLIKRGIYVKYGQKFRFGNKEYWISEELANQIKIKCVKSNVETTELVFSMQEFMNSSIIEKLDYNIFQEHLSDLRNNDDDIYIICAKNTKNNYEPLIKKLDEKLSDLGLKVKNYYFISETFFNRNQDEICHKKIRLILQHLIGLKTDVDKFTEEEITNYDTIYYYDDSNDAIEMSKNINETLMFLQKNSEKTISEKINDLIKSKNIQLVINKVTFNRVNKFITTTVKLTHQNIIKTFESFRYKF
jgi:hypothetical protein